MDDKLVFRMPESLESALWALPVIVQYMQVLLAMRRQWWRCVVIEKHADRHELFRPFLWGGTDIVTEPDEEIVNEPDSIMEFDPERAYALTRAVEKHISESYGILLGVFADIQQPMWRCDTSGHGILWTPRFVDDGGPVLEWGGIDSLGMLLERRNAELRVLPNDIRWPEAVKEIEKAAVVVGPAGSGTLIASSMGKPVLELYPADIWHREWISKWENPHYRMIYSSLDRVSTAFLFDVLWKLVQSYEATEEAKWASARQSPTSAVSETVGA